MARGHLGISAYGFNPHTTGGREAVNQNVASEINELSFVLDKIVALYGDLADVLRAEYICMSDLDIKTLSEATQTKEVLLNEIWNLEQLRISCSEKLAVALGLNPNDATLTSLAAVLPQKDGDNLRAARAALNLLVQQNKELNAKNMEFADQSLVHLDEMKRNVLGINNQASKENYSQSGSRQSLPEQGGRLLSTEA